MAENIGWISIYRKIQDHWIWQDPIKFQWWVDILITVNIEDTQVSLGYQILDCKRGESLLSLQSWASRWHVSKDTARNFLKMLERRNMVVCENVGKTTRLIVCNYDTYQCGLHVNRTHSKRIPNATPTQLNNDNNDNNENKELYAFSSFWDLYDKKKDTAKCSKKWEQLSLQEKKSALAAVPSYKNKTPDDKFRKNPLTWLNGKCWIDEIEPINGSHVKINYQKVEPLIDNNY